MEYKIDKYNQILYITTDGKVATPTISSWEVVNEVIGIVWCRNMPLVKQG